MIRLRHTGLLQRANLLAGVAEDSKKFHENAVQADEVCREASAAVETTLDGLVAALQRCKCFKPSVSYEMLEKRPGPVGIPELAESIKAAQVSDDEEYDTGRAILPAVETLLHPE